MTTYLLRHASTSYSTAHRINGDPTVPLSLDPVGRSACRTGRGVISAVRPLMWVTSTFERTRETACLLMGDAGQHHRVERALNEVDYGQFEGGTFTVYARWLVAAGPWEPPPDAGESQRAAIRRMLAGLRSSTALPSPGWWSRTGYWSPCFAGTDRPRASVLAGPFHSSSTKCPACTWSGSRTANSKTSSRLCSKT